MGRPTKLVPKVILYCSFILSVVTLISWNNPVELKNEIRKVKFVSYGSYDVDVNKAVALSEVCAAMTDEKGEKEFTFKAEITKVCAKAGCWISVTKPDGTSLTIRFKDHFTIPTDTPAGSLSYLHGKAFWNTISVEMLKHFAEDAGKSEEEIAKITEPKYELSFEADGIKIVKEKKK